MVEAGAAAHDARDGDKVAVFNEYRDLLLGIAYRVLGSVIDAEDVVQETWIRWARSDTSEIGHPRAFLVRAATRLAIDRLRLASKRREAYVGVWLPEPLAIPDEAVRHVELVDSVSMAMLVVLETLSPLERAVFVLREAFEMSYGEIADILSRSEAAVRQLASRARAHVNERRPRFTADTVMRDRITEEFLQACSHGDLDSLIETLAPDVELVSDGGGKARAPLIPIHGADRVARFFLGVLGRPVPDLEARLIRLNHMPAAVATSGGEPLTAAVFDVDGDRIRRIYLVANPDKLHGIDREALAAAPRFTPPAASR